MFNSKVLPTRVGLGLSLFVATFAMGQTTGLFREVFTDITGNSVTNLTNAVAYPHGPSMEGYLLQFEAPTNWADNYGQRLRALLIPPTSGVYRFAIASDDASVLYLSPTTNEADKIPIARVDGWTNFRQFNKEANQSSAAIPLTNGSAYYIEVLQKEGVGGDNLSVLWVMPGNVTNIPIPGAFLRPIGMPPPVITSQPPTELTVMVGDPLILEVKVQRSLNVGYCWQRNEQPIPGASNSLFIINALSVTNDQDRYRCIVTNLHGAVTSQTCVLSVVPDTRPPAIASVRVASPLMVEVMFTEPVDPSNAVWTIEGGGAVVAARSSLDRRSVLLTLASPLTTGVTVRVSGVRDLAETPNMIAPGSAGAAFLTPGFTPPNVLFGRRESPGPSTRRTPIAITEIHYNPPDRPDGRDLEFIEIYNSVEWPWDLSGYRLGGEIGYTFPAGTVISGRSYRVIAAAPSDVAAVYGLSNVLGSYTGRLSNGGGTVRLIGRLGEVLLEAEYDDDPPWPAAADGAGHSLVLARPSYGEGDARAWAASTWPDGSPGMADPLTTQTWTGVVINEWLAHTDDPVEDFVELYNASTQAVSLAGFWLSDDPATNKFRIPDGTVIPPGGYLVWTQSQLGFALDAAGEVIVLRAPDGRTVVDMIAFGASANGVSSGRTPDGAPDWTDLSSPTPGAPNLGRRAWPVVINEIMYHPITEDDGDEFIELFNRGTNVVNLSGWRIRGGISFNIPAGIMLPPGGYLVVAADAARWRARCSWLNATNCVGNFAGRLSDRSDVIRLQMPEDLISTNSSGQWVTNRVHVTVNEVRYWDGGQWGSWADGGGSSLELTDPRADNWRPSAWADSDESQKCGWVTIEHTGVLDHGNTSYSATELHVLALGAGEYDLDNVQVLNSSGQNLITNGTFTTGAGGWTMRGSHQDSEWRTDAGESGGGLRIRASWRRCRRRRRGWRSDVDHLHRNGCHVAREGALARRTSGTVTASTRQLAGGDRFASNDQRVRHPRPSQQPACDERAPPDLGRRPPSDHARARPARRSLGAGGRSGRHVPAAADVPTRSPLSHHRRADGAAPRRLLRRRHPSSFDPRSHRLLDRGRGRGRTAGRGPFPLRRTEDRRSHSLGCDQRARHLRDLPPMDHRGCPAGMDDPRQKQQPSAVGHVCVQRRACDPRHALHVQRQPLPRPQLQRPHRQRVVRLLARNAEG